MPRYSVAEAKNNLPKLIDQALAGEEVTITRRGEPVIRLMPQTAEMQAPFDTAWFERHQVHLAESASLSWSDVVRDMRDEDE